MLSTITIISIFTEIFTAGMLAAGAYSFFARFIAGKKRKDLYLALALGTFFIYVTLTVASQMMFGLGRPLSEHILIQKLLAINILLAIFILYLFISEKISSRLELLTIILGIGLAVCT